MPVAYNWTGFYLGINGGYGFGRSNWDSYGVAFDASGGLFGLTAGGAPALVTLIAGSPAVRDLPTEFAEVANRRVDSLLELADGRLLHLEWQSGPDASMPWRMLWYWLLIKQRHPESPLEQSPPTIPLPSVSTNSR